MRKMCTLEKLNFKISRGTIPPDPPSLLAPSALDTIWPGLTLNCFRRAWNKGRFGSQKGDWTTIFSALESKLNMGIDQQGSISKQEAVTTACTRGYNIFCEVLLQAKQTSAVTFLHL